MRLKLARAVLGLTVVVAVVSMVAFFYPPARMTALWAAGRSDCDLPESKQGFAYYEKFAQYMGPVAQSSRIRVDGEYQQWRTPLGDFWFRGEMHAMNRLVVNEQLIDIYGVPETFGVRAGDVVVDCGADYGMFTRRALQHGAAKVFSVEIANYKQECLRRTFAPEIAEKKVVVSEKGVWDEAKTLQLRGDTVIFDRPGARIDVPVAPLDQLLSENGIERVDFMKFDIEGAEPQALRGARQTIAKHRPRIIIATENTAGEKERLGALLNEILPGYRARSVSCAMNPDGLSIKSETTIYDPPSR